LSSAETSSSYFNKLEEIKQRSQDCDPRSIIVIFSARQEWIARTWFSATRYRRDASKELIGTREACSMCDHGIAVHVGITQSFAG
jgi:hypothetical protein